MCNLKLCSVKTLADITNSLIVLYHKFRACQVLIFIIVAHFPAIVKYYFYLALMRMSTYAETGTPELNRISDCPTTLAKVIGLTINQTILH